MSSVWHVISFHIKLKIQTAIASRRILVIEAMPASKVYQNAVHRHQFLPIVKYLLLAGCMDHRQMDADGCVAILLIPCQLIWMKAFPIFSVNFEKRSDEQVVAFQFETISPSASPDPRHCVPDSVIIVQDENDFVSFGRPLLSGSILRFCKPLARHFHYAERRHLPNGSSGISALVASFRVGPKLPEQKQCTFTIYWSLLSTLNQSDQGSGMSSIVMCFETVTVNAFKSCPAIVHGNI